MDPKNIAVLVIGSAVCVMIFSALLVPIVSEATTITDEFTNSGYFTLEKYDDETDLTVEWDHTTPTKITINDEEIALTGFPINKWMSIVVGDDWMLRFANGGTLYFSQLRYGAMQTVSVASNTDTDLTIVCEDGTATVTKYTSGVAGSPIEVTYTELYAISNTGDYVMKISEDSVIMAGDSPILALGTTDLGEGYACMCKITGTIDTGINAEILASTSGTAAIVEDSLTVNKTALSNDIGYSLDNIQFEISDRDSDYDATYSYFIVPAEVTLEKTVHPDNATLALLNVLPILVIMGIVLAVVGVAVANRE